MTMRKVLDRLKGLDDVEMGKGCSAAQIAELEKWLSCKLPMSHKLFLSECGWASFNANEIFGYGKGIPKHLDTSRITLSEQTDMEPQMPLKTVAIMADGAGNHYCLNTKAMKDGECPVIFWDHEHPRGVSQTPKKVARDFAVWLEKLIDEAS